MNIDTSNAALTASRSLVSGLLRLPVADRGKWHVFLDSLVVEASWRSPPRHYVSKKQPEGQLPF